MKSCVIFFNNIVFLLKNTVFYQKKIFFKAFYNTNTMTPGSASQFSTNNDSSPITSILETSSDVRKDDLIRLNFFFIVNKKKFK